MRRMRRALSMLLALAMLLTFAPMPARAAQTDQVEVHYRSETNSLYQTSRTVEKTVYRDPAPRELALEDYPTSYSEVAMDLRESLMAFDESFTFYIRTPEEDGWAVFDEIWAEAVEHTGNPIEGDYIEWQWIEYDASCTATDDGDNYYAFEVEIVYVTNARKEAEMDAAVDTLLNETLPLDDSMSDYEKLKIVYDWICDNIYYDHEHVYDDTYLPQFSAHAALVERVAVCQGYANLLYRLLLTLGIDNRFIGGYTDDGGGHAWNIVELDGLYYNVDATWDAANRQEGLEYEWFLLSEASFVDHNRDPQYVTDAFYAAYPMAAADYVHSGDSDTVPDPGPEPVDWPLSGQCGDDVTWTLYADGLLDLAGTGDTWDFHQENPEWSDYADHVRNVVFGNGITGIGDYLLYGCDNLEWAQVDASVESVGISAFAQCPSLAEVDFLGSAPAFEGSTFFGDTVTCRYPATDPTWTDDVLHDHGGSVTWEPVGGGSDELVAEGQCGDDVYWELDADGYLYIYGTGEIWDYPVEYPGWYDYMPDVICAAVDEGVTRIGDYFFCDTENLMIVILAESVTSVGKRTFGTCRGLTGVEFQGDAPVFAPDAFYKTETLCVYPADNSTWTADVMGDYEGSIEWMSSTEADTFSGQCGDDVTWTLDAEGYLTISGTGDMWDYTPDALPGWHNYVDYVIYAVVEEGVTGIGDCCFYDCGSLAWVEVPSTAARVGEYAFAELPFMYEVIFMGGAPGFAENAFSGTYTTCCYDSEDPSWTADVLQSYGGEVEWMPFEVEIASGECGDEVQWSLNDKGVLVIYGTGDMWDFSRQTPGWQHYAETVTMVFVEEGVTGIGACVFRDCIGLDFIALAASVTHIDAEAFDGCSGLSGVLFGGDAPQIAEDAFRGVQAECVYPSGNDTWTADVMQHYGGALRWMDDEEIFDDTISSGQCGDNVVWSLDENGLLTISGTGDTWDFADMDPAWYDQAENVIFAKIDNDVTGLGDYLFRGCYNLEGVEIAETVTRVGEGVFSGCASLFNVGFLGDAPAIDENAFSGNQFSCVYELGNITWSEDVMRNYGGEILWEPVDILLEVAAIGFCGDDVRWVLDEEGGLFIGGTGDMWDYPDDYPGWYDYMDSLRYAYIDEGVTSIGAFAFFDCENLEEIGIAASVSHVGEQAFAYCHALRDVEFYGDAPEICDDAFYDVNTDCYYPGGNDTWTDDVRTDYEGILNWIARDEDAEDWPRTGQCGDDVYWTLGEDGVLMISGTGPMWDYPEEYPGWYEYANILTEAVIEPGVTAIGSYAFYECEYLRDVTIPDTVTEIRTSAFHRTALEAVTIPDSVVEIGNAAFNFTPLTSVTIPASVERIGAYAFESCGDLDEIHFEGEAPAFGEEVFLGVTAECTYPAGSDTWTADVMRSYGGSLTWVMAEASGLAGDLNGDGAVTSDDAIHLLYHTLFGDLYPVSGDCDYNNDGEINSDDAIYLLYYTLFGDALYPLN